MSDQALKRARSTEAKAERRETILSAADAMLRETGFDDFSMAGLAQKSGVAKGTLYLYFQTREEVFLEIANRLMDAWAARSMEEIKPGLTDAEFCARFGALSLSDPLLPDIATRLTMLIEKNVSIEVLSASKRCWAVRAMRMAAHMETVLDLKPGQGLELFGALAPLMIGTYTADLKAPDLIAQLPDDVQAILALNSFEDRFVPAALLLLKGLRAS